MAKKIYLPNGYPVLVDADDIDRLSQVSWSVSHASKRLIYAVGSIKCAKSGIRRSVAMHRFIMNPPSSMVVDHINGNTLDNRKKNLRIVTHHENALNRPQRKGSSGFRGVSFFAGKWQAEIRINGKYFYLGRFEKKRDAICARKEADKNLDYPDLVIRNTKGSPTISFLKKNVPHLINPVLDEWGINV